MTQPDPPPTSTPPNSSSPLSQVDPQSLDLYFAKQPEFLTDEEVAIIVERLEQDRLKFMANPDNGEPKKTRSAANLGKKVELPTNLSTDDLLKDLGL
jgi:hypothetical protein